MRLDPKVDGPCDHMGIFSDLFFGESQEADAHRFQDSLARGIAVCFQKMSATIDLDGEPEFRRVKIDDEMTDWLLTVKVEPEALTLPEMTPKQDFTEGALIAQLTGQLLELGVVADLHRGRCNTHPGTACHPSF
jgi:hypothetical protein